MFFNTSRKTKKQKVLYVLLPILSIVFILAAYAFVQRRMPLLLPNAEGLWDRFLRTFSTPIKGATLVRHIGSSLRRVLIALVFAWVLGISFGVIIGWSRTCKALLGSIFELLRPIPPIAWIPIIIMWFGIGEFPKVLIVFIGSFIPVVINSQAGVQMVEKEYIQVGRLFGATNLQLLTEFAVPNALPSIFAGIRTSVSSAWSVVLAAEMLGAEQGVGSLVTRGWNAGDMALVFVSIICIGIIGALLAFALNILEKAVCPWNK